MFIIIGIITVFAAVIGGYLMEHGNLHVLFQPAELVIIFGASGGAFLISAPPKFIAGVIKNVIAIIKSSGPGKQYYLDLLSLLYQIFGKIRRDGLFSIEADIENPQESELFKKYAAHILHEPEVINFICDNLKVLITAAIPPHELDSLMDQEIESLHHEGLIPSHIVGRTADGLPGLGIVAAVLGVVLTMGKIDQPPKVLGESIGAALVGTFLGVLMCYGFVGPLSAHLEQKANEDIVALQVIKVALVSFAGGGAPQIAVEFGRRAIPPGEKPDFAELEASIKAKK
ncbi:MAG: flagellar motor stator protein MotA [Candidatus Aureabacteria bacterium]|nr:flagellar motor stator protein MotA [Candidatus Auribacterota bacterium]